MICRHCKKSFKPIKYAEFLLRVDEIWNSYKLSYIFLPRLEQYVITNKIEIPYQYPFSPFCEIGTGGFTSRRNRKNRKAFVSLLIYDHASLEDVQHYLQKTCKFVRRNIQKQSGKPLHRIRKTNNKVRDEEIFELFNKLRDELSLKKGEYKEIFIASYISKKYGKKVSSDYVKKVVSRVRKMKKGDL